MSPVVVVDRAPRELKFDFAARLALRVEVPPLDARREDVPLIARQLLLKAAAASPEAVGRFVRRDGRRPEVAMDPALLVHLLRREYATNARDLVRVLRESMAVSRGDVLELPPNADDERSGTVATPARGSEISEADMRLALERQRWNLTRTAAQLGITRWALMRLMQRYGLRDAS